ncbi:unnamed protein product, partial [Rangifer tarandus platyrhynchus]
KLRVWEVTGCLVPSPGAGAATAPGDWRPVLASQHCSRPTLVDSWLRTLRAPRVCHLTPSLAIDPRAMEDQGCRTSYGREKLQRWTVTRPVGQGQRPAGGSCFEDPTPPHLTAPLAGCFASQHLGAFLGCSISESASNPHRPPPNTPGLLGPKT